jgi:hypothetical protein
VVLALLLSSTAPPLTVWMLVRCFRVDGDCRRSVREGWVAFEPELEAAAVKVLVEEEEDTGVERAMYMFEAADIALVSRGVVPKMT